MLGLAREVTVRSTTGNGTAGASRHLSEETCSPTAFRLFVFPLITKESSDESCPVPRKHILLPYDQRTGRPLDEAALAKHPSLATYFSSQKNQLLARKGTMLNTWMKRGLWWACLGVGENCFAPLRVVLK